ncbi:hypothetical protein [Umezawaea sp.]|uniref:hypothetical protein n=1 Tax=Umezawaea sp. TaxID=1955258 RepID=UPI002ED386AD
MSREVLRALSRAAVLTSAVFATAALSSLTATPAHADPGICIDHVMENGYPATAAVLKACKVAKTGTAADARACRDSLVAEGVAHAVARKACRIASYPD